MTPCQKCKGLCCRYLGIPIDEPRTREDFDDLRWYLAHEGVQVYAQGHNWTVQVMNRCKHLTKDFKCDIYQSRPQVCRNYEADGCDLGTAEWDYDLYFKNDAELAAYIAVRFDNQRADKRHARAAAKKR